MTIPLLERKASLAKIILKKSKNAILMFSDFIIGSGAHVFNEACKFGLEGIISKIATSSYHQKRTKDWVKVKCVNRQEFVIGGFSPPSGSREYFGSLYLGVYNAQGELLYCGNVGTGFNQSSLKDIYTRLLKYSSNQNPFTIRGPAPIRVKKG
jgi:bifunctional non-homologous end joining protein LigD